MTDPQTASTSASASASTHGADAPVVRHLRQALLWPVRLMRPEQRGQDTTPAWQVLQDMGEASPWREVVDEYAGDGGRFQERHYNEFVSFLPYVQRFLYGEGRAAGRADRGGDSPMRVFRRTDIAALRVVPQPGDTPITLQVAHMDLYFFYDVDVVLLNVEIGADDLSLAQAHEQLYRFGRAYPSGWKSDGAALHCMHSVEWLDAQGAVLACSDAQEREDFLAHVSQHRTPRVVSHWAYAMQPLVSDHAGEPGVLRYRQIEYYRMPMMAYLAVDEPQRLGRSEFMRLGLVTGPGADDDLPFAEQHLGDFEQQFCYDRFWSPNGAAPYTRYLCSGHALIVVGDAGAEFFRCPLRGVLAQFRHQHFLLFLIAHFQKAALLMFSAQLVEALQRLDTRDVQRVKAFKRSIRAAFERLLRFTHRYWFHQISDQAQVRALSAMCTQHLDTEALYHEVRERIADMSAYLESDSLRRQANTVMRLTVVTLFGLIGSVTTGFLGMNLLAEADAPWWRKLGMFVFVTGFFTWLTFYSLIKSQRLSDFIDALSDQRLSWHGKFAALTRIWRAGPD